MRQLPAPAASAASSLRRLSALGDKRMEHGRPRQPRVGTRTQSKLSNPADSLCLRAALTMNGMSQFSPSRAGPSHASQRATWALFTFPAFGCALAAVSAFFAFGIAQGGATIILGDPGPHPGPD